MDINKTHSFKDSISGFHGIWIGLELWQQIVVGGLLFLVICLGIYYQFILSKDEEFIARKKVGPLAKYGFSNDYLKLVAVAIGLFFAMFFGAKFIV